MNAQRFQMELALLPVVDGLESLPPHLRDAAMESPELLALVEERVRADRLLELVPEIEPPEWMRDRIVARATAAPARRGLLRIVRPALAVAAAAVLLAVGFALFQGDEPAEKEPVDPDLMASLDILLDWETLQEHEEELDLLACGELAMAVDEFNQEESESAR